MSIHSSNHFMRHGPMADRIRRVLIVGSASLHTWRFLAGIAPYVDEVFVASNGVIPLNYCPTNLAGIVSLDFRMRAWSTARQLRSWVKQIAPQLVHVHQANSVAWHATRAVRDLGLPTVLTAWGSDVLLLPNQHPFMNYMVRHNLAAANVITSDSYTMATRIRELVRGVCRIRLLNYGIDTLPGSVSLTTKEKRVLSCRLHKPLYRIDSILRAWRVVEQSGCFPDWVLTIAASGVETDNLKYLAEELMLQRIDFKGFLEKEALCELYTKSRVFVSVPSSDATSISLLEAMAYGCFPVLSNLPANREWIIDGLNGVIAEDIARLADDLMRSMEITSDQHEWQHSVAINRDLVAKKALHADNMQRFARLYQELISGDAG